MDINKRLARSYCSLLSSIDWSDEVLVKGLREGLGKFLSNAYAACFPNTKKHHLTHYTSEKALMQLKSNNYNNLIFEHIVPKFKYIQRPCEELAQSNELTIDFVHSLLDKYWKLATITKTEDSILTSRNMPNDWNKEDIFARYNKAGIILIKNPYFPN